MSYDGWKLNGYWHTCICGASYSDSDGGPCHSECATKGCEAIALEDSDFCKGCQEAIDKKEVLDGLMETLMSCPLIELVIEQGILTETELKQAIYKPEATL